MHPGFLYHYTSVDTLELILRNKTIRFNPLNKMDDPLEQWSAHGVQEGKHVFVSSWSDQCNEIPDMWKQYCKPGPETGVRIKLPTNPFSTVQNNLPFGIKECLQKQIALVDSFVFWALGKHTIGDLDEDQKLFHKALDKHPEQKPRLASIMDGFTHNTVECYTRDVNSLLHQVTYTNDPNKLFPWLYFDYQGQHFEVYKDFGKYKDTSWAWQHEWRYLLHFRMTTPGVRHADGSIDLYPLPFSYYDLILDNDKLKQMEVTLSPVITKRARKKN